MERNYPRTERRKARIRNVLSRRQPDLTLVLSNIHDPHNVSAVFRSCDAFGVPKVHLYYTDTAFPVLGRKTSASAAKWVETQRHRDAESMLKWFSQRNYQVLATCFTESARPLVEYDFTRPTAVILGNEHDGVGAELLEHVPDHLYIPMQGMVQSLNVSVAAAVTLFEAWRQRDAAGMYETPSIPEDELEAKIAAWEKK